MKNLKDILIDAGEIDKYFDKQVPVNLWRAKNLKSKDPIFGMVERKVVRNNGKVRPADITIYQKGGISWVSVQDRPRGISTFDKPNVFSRGKWDYYKIPAGTDIPNGLAIVEDGMNIALGAKHYTIAPAFDMPLEQFKNLLNILAQILVRESA
ncbi:Tse2 family ADP-ribosyltransferase toxin [Aliikangiella sp. IMCC44359]|uniref:Tse2 family ADP-ribosyltransferase toxin n=1 Tax=Aliikangiella sp. IMCC44359 TaxID=3459125 RepID=UPI00403AEA8E